MRIALCTPHGALGSPEHYRRKAMVQSQLPGHSFTYVEIDMHIVSKARTMIVSAVPADVDVLWFIDSDILLPSNAGLLIRALDQHPVVSGLYFSRRYPHLPQVYNRVSPGLTSFIYLPWVNLPATPFYTDAVGAGCLIVRASVFHDLKDKHDAWRRTVERWTDRWVKRRKPSVETQAILRALQLGTSLTPWFEFLDVVGEDFWFCEALRFYLGLRVLVVPEVTCEHEAVRPVTRADWEAALQQGPMQYVTTNVNKGRGET